MIEPKLDEIRRLVDNLPTKEDLWRIPLWWSPIFAIEIVMVASATVWLLDTITRFVSR